MLREPRLELNIRALPRRKSTGGTATSLLQLLVLSLGGHEDGDVRIGFFPEREEIAVGRTGGIRSSLGDRHLFRQTAGNKRGSDRQGRRAAERTKIDA